MGTNRRTYDVTFKKKAVDMYKKEGMGYKTVAKKLGIDHSMVRRWVKHKFWLKPKYNMKINHKRVQRLMREREILCSHS